MRNGGFESTGIGGTSKSQLGIAKLHVPGVQWPPEQCQIAGFYELRKKSLPKFGRRFSRSVKPARMNRKTIAAYVLRALAQAQVDGKVVTLASLTSELQVRKSDVRAAVTVLHQQGYVDALRMRLSLRGFAVGSALIGAKLPELRPQKHLTLVAA